MALQLRINVCFLLLASFLILNVNGNDRFPEWDDSHWVVDETQDVIELPCKHNKYYPFNSENPSEDFKSVVWILPQTTSHLHLRPGDTTEGWHVNEGNNSLVITKANAYDHDALFGMYVCAVLAKSDLPGNENQENVYAWYYLRWGVGLYTNVAAMKHGTVGQNYYMCFTYAWVSCLVAITIIVLFTATVHFRYKGGPVEGSDEESVESSETSSIKERKKMSDSSSTGQRKKMEVNAEDFYTKI
ncbi:hypothetical protein Aperf_G00000079549 [Anoplocephala perfoliata]